MENKDDFGWYAFIALLVAIILYLLLRKPSLATKNLAICLKNKGVKFYGASWCHFCHAQKELFGTYANLLPYTECINSDKTEVKACTDDNVSVFPTWIFPDGTRKEGLLSIAELSKLAGC